MKLLHYVLLVAGLVIVATIVYLETGARKAPPAVSEKEIPMVSAETLNEVAIESGGMGQVLSWAIIAFAVILQLGAWASASYKLGLIKRADMSLDERFHQLEAIEIYFDLPLYFGLLGSVLSFVLITLHPDAGLMFAYVSTAMGIVVSVILRLAYVTPYKQQLISSRLSD